MRLSFARLCQLAGRLENGAPFIIGLVQILRPGEYPCPLYPFVLAVELEIEPMEAGGRLEMEVVLIDEDGKPVLKIEHGAGLPTAPHHWPGRYWVTFPIPPELTVPAPGSYRFDVSVNGQLLGGERLILAERED